MQQIKIGKVEWLKPYKTDGYIYSMLHALYMIFVKYDLNGEDHADIMTDLASIFTAADTQWIKRVRDTLNIFDRTKDFRQKFGMSGNFNA